MGDYLPILTTEEINESFLNYARLYLGGDGIWIGLTCDNDTDTWIWQDGQTLGYRAVDDDDVPSCSDLNNFAFDPSSVDILWEAHESTDHFPYCICARRGSNRPSTTIIESTTSIGYTEPVTETEEHSSTSSITLTQPTTASTIESTTSIGSTEHSTTTPLWVYITVAICAILFIGCFIGVILFSRRRILSLRAKVAEEQLDKAKKGLNSKLERYVDMPKRDNEWEIERRFVGIDFMNKLGEGAFGSVYLGRVLVRNIPPGKGRSVAELSELTNNNNTVAVKMLHENADSQTEDNFRAEIDFMTKIGYHERLVNMLACVTVSEPILLICEYCSNGDLLDFLRRRRKYMLKNPEDTNPEKVMTVKKQLMFAIQIAYGLEYLSSKGYIHRDIAARNIMVDQQERCKIGDFGLGRSIGKEDENYHAHGGKLPLKWMSPEAIDKYFFSTAADVWSFGVLLYEIVTLGGTPYAGWPAAELLTRLKRGERMDRPENCSEKLFEVMCNCWEAQPSDRPTFTQLRKQFAEQLDDASQDGYDYYLKLNANANYYVLESNASD